MENVVCEFKTKLFLSLIYRCHCPNLNIRDFKRTYSELEFICTLNRFRFERRSPAEYLSEIPKVVSG